MGLLYDTNEKITAIAEKAVEAGEIVKGCVLARNDDSLVIR